MKSIDYILISVLLVGGIYKTQSELFVLEVNVKVGKRNDLNKGLIVMATTL